MFPLAFWSNESERCMLHMVTRMVTSASASLCIGNNLHGQSRITSSLKVADAFLPATRIRCKSNKQESQQSSPICHPEWWNQSRVQILFLIVRVNNGAHTWRGGGGGAAKGSWPPWWSWEWVWGQVGIGHEWLRVGNNSSFFKGGVENYPGFAPQGWGPTSLGHVTWKRPSCTTPD